MSRDDLEESKLLNPFSNQNSPSKDEYDEALFIEGNKREREKKQNSKM